MLTNDITARYNIIESLGYDRIVAPAVHELRHQLQDEMLSQLSEGAHLIEVGSGGGQLARSIVEARPDVRLTGIDILPEQVKRAAKRNRKFADRLSFSVASALDIPFEDNSFDGLISIASIKHWPDPARGLSECRRVLKPGGLLVVVEADRGCSFEAASHFVNRWRIPGLLKPLALMFFRTYVAGQSFDAEEAGALLDALHLEDSELRRLTEFPGLILMGRKPQV